MYDITTFLNSTSREQAEEFIKTNCETKNDIINFAKQTDTYHFSSGTTKDKMIFSIIAQTVGARLNSEAIQKR